MSSEYFETTTWVDHRDQNFGISRPSARRQLTALVGDRRVAQIQSQVSKTSTTGLVKKRRTSIRRSWSFFSARFGLLVERGRSDEFVRSMVVMTSSLRHEAPRWGAPLRPTAAMRLSFVTRNFSVLSVIWDTWNSCDANQGRSAVGAGNARCEPTKVEPRSCVAPSRSSSSGSSRAPAGGMTTSKGGQRSFSGLRSEGRVRCMLGWGLHFT